MGIATAISLLVLIGWLINDPSLASFGPNFLPMAPVTAFIFLGINIVWFIQRIFNQHAGVRILLRVVLLGLLIVILSLGIKFITGIGPDIQKLLTPNPPAFGLITTGRMSPLTALGFIFSITAYIQLNGKEQGKGKPSISAIISLAVFILSGINCLGYLYKAPFFYGGTLIPVALPTALSFLFLESEPVNDSRSRLLACQDVCRALNKSPFDANFYPSIHNDRRPSGLSKFNACFGDR